MPRKKKTKQEIIKVNSEILPDIQIGHINELETNPLYSLEVDPENKYDFSQETKLFIENYIEFRNFSLASELAKLDFDKAKEIFSDYRVKNEIRRINRALYQRQFAAKMLNLDQLGSYLSSAITDEFVPTANHLSPKEKLKAIELLLEIQDIKTQSINNPTLIINKDINLQLKELSVESIKELLEQSKNKNEKTEIIEDLNKENLLTIEDKAYLETLPLKDLIDLVNETTRNRGDKNE